MLHLVHNRDGRDALNIMIEKVKSATIKRGQQFDREKARKRIVEKVANVALAKAHSIFEEEFQRLIHPCIVNFYVFIYMYIEYD